MPAGRWSIGVGRMWAAALLLVSPIAILAAVLVFRADAQTAAARWSGGRNIRVFLQPGMTAPEARALEGEAAAAEGVGSARVATLSLPVEFCRGLSFAGHSLLPCSVQPNSTLYLDVVASSRSQVSHVEADMVGRAGVLAVADTGRMVEAKLRSYRSWRDLGVGACVAVMALIAVLILRRPRWPALAP
ncbi:MAG TPA: hypothetical protein VLX59_10525 [Acidimicrobiales bacterium]|nr:hypothetical protein [Acidimicrobiales bacterium]